MTSTHIDALLARARANDRTALSALLQAYEPRLLRMIELRLDRALQSRIEPDDLLQETFLEAVRRFDEWNADPRCPFHVWLRLTCAKSLITAQRAHFGAQKRDVGREQAFVDRPSVSAANVAEYFVANQTSPSQAASREEAHTLMVDALEELDEMDREILVLRNFEELTNEEAAAELGIEPAAASKRFARALLRLRPALRVLEE